MFRLVCEYIMNVCAKLIIHVHRDIQPFYFFSADFLLLFTDFYEGLMFYC